MKHKIFKVGGLFSGVGGIELGFSIKNKFQVVWGSDIDKYASKTYKVNHKHVFYEKDINLLKGSELENVDVLVGGFPCQAFSVAGYRKGFNDDRGNVFFQIVRLIDEFKIKPKVLFLENVKNIYTHDKKNTFRIIQETLEQLGYCVITKVLNTSAYTKIPQNRERTFIICFLEGRHAYLEDPKSMSSFFYANYPPRKEESKAEIANFLEKERVDKKYYYSKESYLYEKLKKEITKKNTFYQWRRVYVRENKSGVCPTLTANMGTGGHNVPIIKDDYGVRKLTPKECFNLQGFPKKFKFPEGVPDSQLYKQAGNSVTVEIVKKQAEIIYKALVN